MLWAIAANRHGRLARIALIEAGINLVLSIGLGIAFGLIGVAAASCVTFLISNGVVMPRLLFPMLGLNWRICFLRPILLSSLVVLSSSGLLRWLLCGDRVGTGLVVAAVLLWAVLIFVILFVLIVGRGELHRLLGRPRRAGMAA